MIISSRFRTFATCGGKTLQAHDKKLWKWQEIWKKRQWRKEHEFYFQKRKKTSRIERTQRCEKAIKSEGKENKKRSQFQESKARSWGALMRERKKEKGEGFQPLSIKIVETSAEPASYQKQPIWWRRHPADSAAPPPHNDTLCSRPRAHVNPPPPVRQLSVSLLASPNGLGTSKGSVVNLRSAGDHR